jgi:hypothetical protein
MRMLKFFGISLVGVGLAFAGSSAAFAKAHDQGQADGRINCPTTCDNARDQIDFLTAAGALDGHGVSAVQNKGKRGEQRRTANQQDPGAPAVDPKSRPGGFPPGQNKTY